MKAGECTREEGSNAAGFILVIGESIIWKRKQKFVSSEFDEGAHVRRRTRARARSFARTSVVISFSCVADVLLEEEERHDHYGSLSLFLSVRKAMMDDHIARALQERERALAQGRTHSLFFRIERFARAHAYSRERERRERARE